jgi:hypothetical protein
MEFHPISELDARMDPEILANARRLCKRDILSIKLKAVREKYGVKYSIREGIKQPDVTSFALTEHTVAKLGSKMRLSTFLDYVESLDMGLEIVALPKGENAEREILLKI